MSPPPQKKSQVKPTWGGGHPQPELKKRRQIQKPIKTKKDIKICHFVAYKQS